MGGWPVMHGFVATLPRLYGRSLGDLCAKGLVTVATARARVASFVVPKKDGRQLVKQITILRSHHTHPLRQPELVVTSAATRCYTFFKIQG